MGLQDGGGVVEGVDFCPSFKGLLPGIGIGSEQGRGCLHFEKCPKNFVIFFRGMLLGVLGYLAGARIDLRTLSHSNYAASGSVSSKCAASETSANDGSRLTPGSGSASYSAHISSWVLSFGNFILSSLLGRH